MNLETINSEFSYIQVWFTDNKHSKLLQIQDEINIGKNTVVNTARNYLIIIKNLPQMQLKLLQKDQFKYQKKQVVN